MAIFVPRFVRQLRDVLLTAPADGEVLTYDSADEKWKNEAGGGGGGDLTDAVILAPASSARNVIQPTAGDVIAAIVKAHAAQSVDLTQWQLSDGTLLGRIGATGKVSLTRSDIPADINDFAQSLVSQSVPGAFPPFEYTLHQIFGRPGIDNNVNFTYSPGADSGDIVSYTIEDGSISVGITSLFKRRASDDAIIMRGTFSPSGFSSSDWDPDIDVSSQFIIVDSSAYGYFAAGSIAGQFLVAAGYDENGDATDKIIETNPAGGVARIGLYGVTPVVQQAASTLAALWTGLENYGWLTAGSTVPTVYEPGGIDVALTDGGTGASTAAGARTNLDVPSNAEAILDAIMDAKGDLLAATAADTPTRLAVGTNGHVLTADSAEATGVKWAAAAGGGSVATDAIWDAKGDLAIGTGANTAARLAVGANGTRPVAASGESTGVAWSLPPGYEVAFAEVTSDVVVTATVEASANTVVSLGAVTYTAVRHVFRFFCAGSSSNGTGALVICLFDDSTEINRIYIRDVASNSFDLGSFVFFLTPSAGSHTYIIKAFKAGATSHTFQASAIGSGADYFPIQFQAAIA